jgi:hypothetical protein
LKRAFMGLGPETLCAAPSRVSIRGTDTACAAYVRLRMLQALYATRPSGCSAGFRGAFSDAICQGMRPLPQHPLAQE